MNISAYFNVDFSVFPWQVLAYFLNYFWRILVKFLLFSWFILTWLRNWFRRIFKIDFDAFLYIISAYLSENSFIFSKQFWLAPYFGFDFGRVFLLAIFGGNDSCCNKVAVNNKLSNTETFQTKLSPNRIPPAPKTHGPTKLWNFSFFVPTLSSAIHWYPRKLSYFKVYF